MAIPQNTRQFVIKEIGSIDNIHLQEGAPIEALKDDEVLVKVHAVSLQYRDLVIATGEYPTTAPANLVPGSDAAGEIVSVGRNVTAWSVGDRVCANFSVEHLYGAPSPTTIKGALGGNIQGVLTEYKIFPAKALVAIPKHLSYQEASTLPCAGLTAYNALTGFKAVKAGDYVLIQGTGGVSIFGLQIAIASGATVIVTSSSDEKLKNAKKLGAHHLINYKTTPNWDEEALKITGGVGVDHIVEVGGPNTMAKSLNAIRMGGQIYVIGFVAKDGKPEDYTLKTLRKGASVHGILIGSVHQFNDFVRLLSARPEQTRPVVDKVFPFEQTVDAYKYLKSQAHVGKVVIQVSKE